MPRSDVQAGLDYVDACLRDLNTATETRDLSPEEWAAIDEGLAYVADARSQLARYDALKAAADTPAARPADGARDFQHQRRVDTEYTDVRSLAPGELRDKALKVLERAVEEQGSDPIAAAKVERLARRSDGWVAARLLETENDLYRSAFMKMINGRPLSDSEARAMNITTTTAGGFGVPVLIDPTIMITDQGSTNPFWSIANVQTITTNQWKGVSAAGVTFAFETESAAANDLTPTLAQPAVYAHRIQGALPFTIEVEMDYPSFAAEAGALLLSGYDEKVLEKFTIGTGTGEPWGVFEACEQATSQVTVGTDAGLAAADINKVFTALPQKYRQNASWLMSIDVNQDIQALGDDKLATQTVNLAAGAIDVLKNRPVYESAYAPSFTGTTGPASIAVIGDFRNFVIAQRAGLNVETVQHLVDTTTGLPTGQRALYAWARVGSDVVVDNAFRMLVNT
jgi:HK97 family phage major capsid protein